MGPCPRLCMCPALFAPVCGSNGQTYSNACNANCEYVHNGKAGVGGDAIDFLLALVFSAELTWNHASLDAQTSNFQVTFQIQD